MHEEITNLKHQIPKLIHRFLMGKLQNTMTKITNEKLLCLEFEIWDLFVFWCLGFVIL
jgi:hypothetical protein